MLIFVWIVFLCRQCVSRHFSLFIMAEEAQLLCSLTQCMCRASFSVLEFLNSLYGGQEPIRNRVVVPARRTTQPSSLESILGLLRSLTIRARTVHVTPRVLNDL
jgi:hypothetical protein